MQEAVYRGGVRSNLVALEGFFLKAFILVLSRVPIAKPTTLGCLDIWGRLEFCVRGCMFQACVQLGISGVGAYQPSSVFPYLLEIATMALASTHRVSARKLHFGSTAP